MRPVLAIFLYFSFTFCCAQSFRIFRDDTTRVFFPKSYGEKKWKPVLGFDAFRSFYSGTPVKFNGLRFGIDYRGVHRFGFGFYGLKKDLIFTDLIIEHPQATDTSQVKFKLNYAAFFYERVFYKSRKWELSIPLYLGGGGLEGYVEGADGIFYNYLRSSFSLFNAGLNIKYYLLPWLVPRVGMGMRFTFNAEKNLRKAFNGAYYSFGISVPLGELYKAVFKDKKGGSE